MIAPVHVLFAERHGFEFFFGNSAVVAEREHYFKPVFVGERKVFFEVIHKRIVLIIPAFELNNGAHGVKPGFFGKIKFVFYLLKNLFVFVFLPHGYAVYAVRRITVIPANPGLFFIPLPGAFFTPLPFNKFFFHKKFSFRRQKPYALIFFRIFYFCQRD